MRSIFLQLFKYIHIWVFSGTFCHDRVIVYHKMFHHEFSSLSNFVLQIVAFFRCMLYYHFSLAYSSFVSESCKIIDGYRPNTTETAGQIFATPRIFTDRSVTLNPFQLQITITDFKFPNAMQCAKQNGSRKQKSE